MCIPFIIVNLELLSLSRCFWWSSYLVFSDFPNLYFNLPGASGKYLIKPNQEELARPRDLAYSKWEKWISIDPHFSSVVHSFMTCMKSVGSPCLLLHIPEPQLSPNYIVFVGEEQVWTLSNHMCIMWSNPGKVVLSTSLQGSSFHLHVWGLLFLFLVLLLLLVWDLFVLIAHITPV